MTLKPVTLRLDKDEYEKLKELLNSFGDPDINVAYVLRSYIRDLNRALPFMVKSTWDLKNYFAFLGVMLKQFGGMTDGNVLTKGMFDWGQYWKYAMGMPHEGGGIKDEESGTEGAPPRRKEGGAEKE